MRIPVPTNRLVVFALIGALLTTVVAAGLAFPAPGLGQSADTPGDQPTGTQQLTADAPTPNQSFTPAVQTQAGYDEEHEDEYEDEHEEEHEDEHEENEDHEDPESRATENERS